MKKIIDKLLILTFLLPILYLVNLSSVQAHTDWKIGHPPHDPITCIPDNERSFERKHICRDALKRHRLCKEDQHCKVLELEKATQELADLKSKIQNQNPINCSSLTFSHVALEDAPMFKDTSGNSEIINKVKKGQKVSFVGSTDKDGWIIIVPKSKVCKIGYINESYIGLSTSTIAKKKEAPKIKSNIEITYPKWKKLMS